jgi:lysozyme
MRKGPCATVLLAALGACGGGSVDIGRLEVGQVVCAPGTTTPGIDVSHWDGTINWAAVSGAGIQFAFMKATEGTTFVDPQFQANWSHCAQNQVIRGAYHFFHPATDPIAQADFFVQTAGVPQPGDLPPTLDFETTDGLGGAAAAQSALQFLQRVEQKTQRTPILYSSSSFFNGTLGGPAGFDSYLLWDANWYVQCPNIPDPPWTHWTLWQNSAMGTIAGIAGMNNVDLDEFNGSLSDLQAFVHPTVAQTDAGSDGAALDLAGPADLAPSMDLAAPIDMTSPVDMTLPVDLGGSGATVDLETSVDLARATARAPDMGTWFAPRPGCSCAVGATNDPAPSVTWMALLSLVSLGLFRRRAKVVGHRHE